MGVYWVVPPVITLFSKVFWHGNMINADKAARQNLGKGQLR